ncbi:MAG: general secretion pathway protein GspE [Anaeromyxobacter sp.]
MAQRVGQLLIEEGAITRDALGDALRNQVIFGGRLGTNLLELGGVQEEPLARALGRRHGVPYVAGSPGIDPVAVRLVRPEVADRYQMVPYALQGRQLAVLARDPSDLAALDGLSFASGKQVQPLVAAEARIWALLRQLYGIEHHLRGIDVDFGQRPRPAAPGEVGAGSGAGGVELMDEAAFDALYRTRPPGAPFEPLLARPPTPAAPPAWAPPTPTQPPPRLAGPPGPPSLASPPLEEGPLLPGTPVPGPWTPSAPPPDEVIELTDELEELEPAPLSFDEAVRLLAGVSARDAIAEAVLRYARRHFKRAVLLTVNRGVASGWVGLGEGLTPLMVRRLRLSLGEPGLVDTVVRTQAHLLGPIPRTVANAALLRGLGGGVPANAFLVPILAMGRVVNVFYGDAGRGALVDAGGVGELLILATRIAQSYERLLSAVRGG